MTWVFSIWAAFRTWQEGFPAWKQRVFCALLAAYALLSLDVIL